MSTSPTDLGSSIKRAREARGWSQKELADRAGIGKTAMFDLEHGNPGVRYNTLTAVLDILGFSMELVVPNTVPSPASAEAVQSEATEPTGETLPEHLL